MASWMWVLASSTAAQYLSSPAKEPVPYWWQLTTGILAIPVAIVGLAYSYVLIKKTRLEAKKTELEIKEKQAQLDEVAKSHADFVQHVLSPIPQSPTYQSLILRLVLLFVILQAWRLLERGYQFVLYGLVAGLLAATGNLDSLDTEPLWLIIPYVILREVPSVGCLIVLFVIGWPLLKEINAAVGLNLQEFFSLRRSHKKNAEIKR